MEGELDASTAPLVEDLLDHPGPIVLDPDGVTFLDAAGVGALIRLYRRGRSSGWPVHIDYCSAAVKRVLQLVDLYDTLAGPDVLDTAV